MTPWHLRTWPEDDGRDDEHDAPAEPELADEQADRVERDQTKEW